VARKNAPREPRQRPGAALADKLARLGIARDADLALHLPLRYEDHTRLVPLAALAPGVEQQAEGRVVSTEIQYRPRRQLVCLIEEQDEAGGRAQLVLRFFHFYPNQQKALAAGRRVRVFGEVREGHYGREIVHPQFNVVELDAPLPD
jgi:ATP-dependent DNA helicase RecG